MILPDVNVLVHAFRESAEDHAVYARWLGEASRHEDLPLPDAVVTGFVRITTNPAVVQPPVTAAGAFGFVDALRRTAWVRTALGSRVVLDRLRELCADDPGIRGNLVTDAYLAAAAIAHDARLATRDHGFATLPRAPLVRPGRRPLRSRIPWPGLG